MDDVLESRLNERLPSHLNKESSYLGSTELALVEHGGMIAAAIVRGEEDAGIEYAGRRGIANPQWYLNHIAARHASYNAVLEKTTVDVQRMLAHSTRQNSDLERIYSFIPEDWRKATQHMAVGVLNLVTYARAWRSVHGVVDDFIGRVRKGAEASGLVADMVEYHREQIASSGYMSPSLQEEMGRTVLLHRDIASRLSKVAISEQEAADRLLGKHHL